MASNNRILIRISRITNFTDQLLDLYYLLHDNEDEELQVVRQTLNDLTKSRWHENLVELEILIAPGQLVAVNKLLS